MRDIRFRAFVNDIMGDAFDPFDPVFMSQGGTFPEGTIFMQYVGLKDKNGKEMYEGDICRIHFYHDKTSVVGVMEWLSDASFCIRADTIYSPQFRSGGDFGDYPAVEVIGNIHEHPHLIEKQ